MDMEGECVGTTQRLADWRATCNDAAAARQQGTLESGDTRGVIRAPMQRSRTRGNIEGAHLRAVAMVAMAEILTLGR